VIDPRSAAATVTRIARSSTLAAGFSPSFGEAADASSVLRRPVEQLTLTKSP
jgi:hypothetical protein